MSELEQAIQKAQADHLARLNGPKTCCVTVGPGNMPCGQPVEYLTPEQAHAESQLSGWHHIPRDRRHGAVPSDYAR